MLLLPLINGENVLNVFAIQAEGILDRGRFVRWKRIKEYRFIPIDLSHKFYGYTNEVNDGYELLILRGFRLAVL